MNRQTKPLLAAVAGQRFFCVQKNVHESENTLYTVVAWKTFSDIFY